jgi:hypothetical protein
MAGTITGGRNAAATNKAKYGDDFYARIGAIGGRKGHTGGFAARVPCYCVWDHNGHVKANCAGAKGGRISRRGRRIPSTTALRAEMVTV